MNERAVAMGLSILGGLIFIVIVPKLLSGFLGITSTEGTQGTGYGAGRMLAHIAILALGGLCFWKANHYWKRVRAKEKAETEAEDWDEEEYDSEEQSDKR